MRLYGLLFVLASLACAQNTAKFPGSVPTYNDLGLVANRAETTLVTDVNATATTLPVLSGSQFAVPGFVTIDNEIMAVCAKASNSLTVGYSSCPNVDGRGWDGTSPAAHLATRPVQQRIIAWTLNQLAAETIAIAEKLHKEAFSVRDFGAKGDYVPGVGGTDDTAAIQAAIDACDYNTFGVVRFPAGFYRITQTIDWKSCSLQGDYPQHVNLFWDGVPGGIGINKTFGPPNSNFVKMEGFGLRPGTAAPLNWIYFHGPEYFDKFTKLQYIHFVGSTGDAVKLDVGYWANQQWEDLRFDSIGGYGIHLTLLGAPYGGQFVLDRFTYDNNAADGGGLGLIGFENKIDGVFLMTARVSNGRIETNDNLGGNKALFSFLNNGGGQCTFMSLDLNNVFYQNVTGERGQSLFYHDTACTGGTANTPIVLTNVGASGIDSVFSGKTYVYGSVFPLTGVEFRASLATFGTWGQTFQGTSEFVGYEGNVPTLSVRQRTDSGPTAFWGATGKLNYSNGAGAPPDVSFGKLAAGLMGVDVGSFYFPDPVGAVKSGGIIKVGQNGVYLQRTGTGADANYGGLQLGAPSDPERGCIGAGSVSDCGTFTPVAEQSAYVRFNAGAHSLFGANVEIVVDDDLTPNLGPYDPLKTYAPTLLLRAMSLGGVKTIQLGTDAGAKLLVTQTEVRASGGFTGKAMCWKADGALGYCSTAVDASGGCTCN